LQVSPSSDCTPWAACITKIVLCLSVNYFIICWWPKGIRVAGMTPMFCKR
jgi:hypothetical protein